LSAGIPFDNVVKGEKVTASRCVSVPLEGEKKSSGRRSDCYRQKVFSERRKGKNPDQKKARKRPSFIL